MRSVIFYGCTTVACAVMAYFEFRDGLVGEGIWNGCNALLGYWVTSNEWDEYRDAQG